jgi:hypothetical protein
VSGFSTEELAAIPDEQLVDAVLGVVWASGTGLDEATLVKILDASPEGFGVVHSVWLLDSEIQNGGFHQYFWNHKDVHVEITRRALARLGAMDHLALFEEALSVLQREPSGPSGGSPQEVLEAFSQSAPTSALNPLDSRWYNLPELAPMLVAYLRANPEAVWEADD